MNTHVFRGEYTTPPRTTRPTPTRDLPTRRVGSGAGASFEYVYLWPEIHDKREEIGEYLQGTHDYVKDLVPELVPEQP